MSLQGKVAFVTGGSRGIGRACALVLAQAGADVAVGGRDEARLGAVAAEIEGLGRKPLPVSVDLRQPDRIKTAFEQVMSAFGRLDILVNNAGVTRDGLLLRMKPEDWSEVLQTNLTATYLCTQAAVKIMLRQRYGRIVNLSSVVGLTGNVGQANYVASKAGIIGLTKTVAQEVAKRNITVNAVAPGFVETAMTQALPETARAKLLERIPMGRAGLDREIALGVRFLASDEAGYVTGQVLHINGGLYM